MRYTVVKSIAQFIGKTWMPGYTAAREVELSACDLEEMKDGEGNYTRDSVERWILLSLSGDFQSVEDFRAEIEDGDRTIEFGWKDEESEFTFSDCMYPSEDFED